jgi:hypothetical protein
MDISFKPVPYSTLVRVTTRWGKDETTGIKSYTPFVQFPVSILSHRVNVCNRAMASVSQDDTARGIGYPVYRCSDTMERTVRMDVYAGVAW